MFLPFRIALRYLFSPKSTNAINVIAGTSALGMLGGTMALVIVLSVFNGFEGLVVSLYDAFNPDLKVTPLMGKTFVPDRAQLQKIRQMGGIHSVSEVLEENALFQYKDKDQLGRLKGVDEHFTEVSHVDTAIVDGEFKIKGSLHEAYRQALPTGSSTDTLIERQDFEQPDRELFFAVIGLGIQAQLGINLQNHFVPLKVFMPMRTSETSTTQIERAFKQETLQPVGAFALQQDFDGKYVITSIDFARKLLDYETDEVSALEISVQKGVPLKQVKSSLQSLLGKDFKVRDRYEQDETLYKVMKTEKWAVYFILTFILLLAAFNMLGSLSMLVIEKKRDIGILKAMGADSQLIFRTFLTEGVLLSVVGGGIGMVLAIIICYLQQRYGFLQIGGNSFLVKAYPVSLHYADLLLVGITVLLISFVASYIPAQRAAIYGSMGSDD